LRKVKIVPWKDLIYHQATILFVPALSSPVPYTPNALIDNLAKSNKNADRQQLIHEPPANTGGFEWAKMVTTAARRSADHELDGYHQVCLLLVVGVARCSAYVLRWAAGFLSDLAARLITTFILSLIRTKIKRDVNWHC